MGNTTTIFILVSVSCGSWIFVASLTTTGSETPAYIFLSQWSDSNRDLIWCSGTGTPKSFSLSGSCLWYTRFLIKVFRIKMIWADIWMKLLLIFEKFTLLKNISCRWQCTSQVDTPIVKHAGHQITFCHSCVRSRERLVRFFAFLFVY